VHRTRPTLRPSLTALAAFGLVLVALAPLCAGTVLCPERQVVTRSQETAAGHCADMGRKLPAPPRADADCCGGSPPGPDEPTLSCCPDSPTLAATTDLPEPPSAAAPRALPSTGAGLIPPYLLASIRALEDLPPPPDGGLFTLHAAFLL